MSLGEPKAWFSYWLDERFFVVGEIIGFVCYGLFGMSGALATAWRNARPCLWKLSVWNSLKLVFEKAMEMRMNC